MIDFLTLANRRFKHLPEEKIIQKLKDLDSKYDDYKLLLFPVILSSAASDDSTYYHKLASVCLVKENNSFYSERNIERLLELDRESGGIVYI